MNTYLQPNFFDVETRTAKLTEMDDPLVGLNAQIDWEAFRSDLQRVHSKARKNNVGAKPKDVVLMFKILVLQQRRKLSDDRIEYPIRERLKELNLMEALFDRFHEQLAQRGYVTRAGHNQRLGCRLWTAESNG